VSSIAALLRLLWVAPNSLLGVLVALPVLWRGGFAKAIDGTIEVSRHDGRVPAGSRWHRLPFVAITLGHVVVGVSDEALERLRTHEQAHVRQYERWGPFFLPAYGLASLVALVRGGRAYVDNVFEVEARRVAADAARTTAAPAHRRDTARDADRT
jgi:hypothetical protein